MKQAKTPLRDSPPPATLPALPNSWLVESPRRITHENTAVCGPDTALSGALTDFHHTVVCIPENKLETAVKRCQEFVEFLLPKVVKYGLQCGLKVKGVEYGGSTFDNTQVIEPYSIELFLTFDRHKAKTDTVEAGYYVVPIKRYREVAGQPPDPHRYGRSDDGLYVSSMAVAKTVYELVEKSLKTHPKAKLQPFTVAQNSAQIVVRLKRKYELSIIPASFVESDNMFLITRPYAYDVYPPSHIMWRTSHINKERRILVIMDSADRGIRTKAFKVLKALVQLEPTLDGLTSYHVKTVLLHSFDSAVDHTRRWQRDQLHTAFLALLSCLHQHLAARCLPHFFIRGYNLFGNMESRRLAALQSRVGYLLHHHNEITRILKNKTTSATENGTN